MPERGARDAPGMVVRVVAGIVGALLALFGGGCVLLGVAIGVLDPSSIILIVAMGVLPLVAGIRLLGWATRRR